LSTFDFGGSDEVSNVLGGGDDGFALISDGGGGVNI